MLSDTHWDTLGNKTYRLQTIHFLAKKVYCYADVAELFSKTVGLVMVTFILLQGVGGVSGW